ncbi:MAG TPA: zinc ribbon domain-containing protein [Gemmataceae bacterium]|jgi:hypothetical protein
MSSAPPDPNRDIPPGRRQLYYAGMAVTAVGFLLFLSNFCIMPLRMGQGFPDNPGGEMFGFAARAVGGMVLLIVGSFMMAIGARGWAGSGMILNPRQARKDVEPWARTAGGVLGDALEEVGPLKKMTEQQPPPVPEVKVRCRSCGALNDETARFCSQCGKPL